MYQNEDKDFEEAGLRCPVCGSKNLQAIVENLNENYWICSKCGHKFRRLQDVEGELWMLKGRRTLLLVTGLILYIILAAVSAWAFHLDNEIRKIGILYIAGVIFIASTLILLGKFFATVIKIGRCKRELDHVRNSF